MILLCTRTAGLLLVLLTSACVFDRGGVEPTDPDPTTELAPLPPGGWSVVGQDGSPGFQVMPASGDVGVGSAPPAGGGGVVICHVISNPPHTITVDPPALAAHLAHGDFLGPCP
jgi:hypothetical protein